MRSALVLMLMAVVAPLAAAQSNDGKCRVKILVPDGAKVILNDNSEMPVDKGVCDCYTIQALASGKVHYWDIRIELTKNGKTYKETRYLRLWPDRKMELDVTDLMNPDKKIRTERFWNEIRQLHADFEPLGNAKPADATKALNLIAAELERLTTRGVDADLVKETLDLPERYRVMGKLVYLLSPEGSFENGLLRGLTGGDFGDVINDVVSAQKKLTELVDQTKTMFGKQRKLLSNRYDIDLSEIK